MDKLDKIPAILLDCEHRITEGLIQTLGRKGIPIVAISYDKKCPGFRSRFVTKKFVLPRISDDPEKYITTLESLPLRGVLVYSNDVSAMVISEYRERLSSAGFLINIPDLSTLLKVFDKWEAYSFVKSLGIPVAKTRLVQSVDDVIECWHELEKPLILKGTRLAGGNYKKLSNRDDLKQSFFAMLEEIRSDGNFMRNSKIILQEWKKFSVTDSWHCLSFYDKNSNPLGFFTIKKIRSSINKDGSFTSRLFAGEYKRNEELENMTEKILSAVKWRGFASFDYYYVPSEEKQYFTEVNPRAPGFSLYPSKAGFDMGYYYYADLVGLPIEKPASFPKSIYFETFRLPGDLTSGIEHILRGNLKLLPFIKSYLRLFENETRKVIEPIRTDDPGFTFFRQVHNLRRIIRYFLRFIINKIHRNV